MDTAERGRPIEILFVGSEPGDVRSTRSALRADGIANAMSIVPSVSDALAYLHRRGDYADVDRPDVVLLDHDSADDERGELHEAVAALYEDAPVPIIGLRSEGCPDGDSTHPCLEKPVDGVALIDVVVEVGNIWVRIVNGPRRE